VATVDGLLGRFSPGGPAVERWPGGLVTTGRGSRGFGFGSVSAVGAGAGAGAGVAGGGGIPRPSGVVALGEGPNGVGRCASAADAAGELLCERMPTAITIAAAIPRTAATMVPRGRVGIRGAAVDNAMLGTVVVDGSASSRGRSSWSAFASS